VFWTLSFLRNYRGRAIAITTLATVEILFSVLAPWPLKIIVDNVLSGYPLPGPLEIFVQSLIGSSAIALLVLVVVTGLLLQLAGEIALMFHTQLQVNMGQHIVYDLRAKLLKQLQALPLGHHVKTATSDSVYRLDADAYCVNDLVMGGVFPLAMSALKLSIMFVILVRLDPTLALLSLTVAPFLYTSLRYYSRKMIDRAERVKMREATLLERAYEILSAVKVIKSFAREQYESARFIQSGTSTMEARLRLTWQESLFSVTISAITLAGTALILVVGGMHVLSGELTTGGLLVVIAYLAAVYNPLSSIAHTVGALQQAIVSANRVQDILSLTPEVLDAPEALDASSITGTVCFDDVAFAYEPNQPVLNGVSFTANPGELVALVGLTGAGKTSLANLIPRFFESTRGHVLIDNVDVSHYSLRSLREQVAMVPQETVLFSDTIANNIRYGRLDATEAEVEAAARTANIHTFIKGLPHGYQTPVAEAGGTLSGGERQRLGIARALLKRAPILVLDEPTSALDAISEAAIFDALQGLRENRTILVIAHRLSTIRDATRILVLHEGKLIAQGSHDELLTSNTLYRRMCARLSVGRSLDDPESVDEIMQTLP